MSMTIPGLDAWITGDYGQRDRRGRPLWQREEEDEMGEVINTTACPKCDEAFPGEYGELCPLCAAEQAVIKAAAEWADIYDRWHALTGRDSDAVVSGLRDVLEKKERQLRGAYTALTALDEAAK